MIPGKQYTPVDLLEAVWRRKWLVLVTCALITAGTVVIVGRLPNRFRAAALIATVPQGVSQDFVRGTVATKTQITDRLPTISQQILSRQRLEPIIVELDLYADMRRAKPMEAVVEKMRGDIHIDIVGASESIRVSYEAATPSTAKNVAEKLADVAIAENQRDRAVLAQATRTFLESQLEDARGSLVEREKRLEAYRLKYGAELPTQLQSNMQAIQNTQMQIQALNESLNRDRDRRLFVARQLADLEAEQFLTDPRGTGKGLSPTGTTSAPPESSAEAQLKAARAELEAKRLQLTPEHPDLVRLQHQVADLDSRAKIEASAAGSSSDAQPRPPTATEITKRNRMRELQAEIDDLDRQIANRLKEEVGLRKTFEMYRARVEAVPTRESELAALTRDYDTLQGLYRTLLAKKEDAKVAEELERQQVGEQFKIVDPPRLPERPIRPNRRVIDLAGAVGGLVFGVLVALLFEFLDKSLKVESDVQAVLSLPVLAFIPLMMTAAERRRARWRKAAVGLGLAMIFAMCATAVWLTFRV